VGATAFYFVDTADDEQVDIAEIMGPGAVGPIYVNAELDWGGHAIVLDSMWVAPDRRRAGIATAMSERIAGIGLPAWGLFRDPWFAAYFLHRWPPLDDVERALGTYWPWWEEYVTATEWGDRDRDRATATVKISARLSPDDYSLMTDVVRDPAEFLASLLRPRDDVRVDLDQGGWTVSPLEAKVKLLSRDGDARLSGSGVIEYLAGPLYARAGLNRYLRRPFDDLADVNVEEDALGETAIADCVERLAETGSTVEGWSWQARPASTSRDRDSGRNGAV
jgi:hypothetical protein